jgi:UDP-N-acetylglucosamine transferase subunit ALG13
VVFVTVGNARQGFSRLVSAVDALSGTGAFGEEPVLIQRGHTRGDWLAHCRSVDFLPSDEFERHLSEASLVVCHGGTSQLSAIRLGKIPIVMPRLRKFGEHVNDHQLQLVQALAAEGLVVPAYEPGDLAAAITEARQRRGQPVRACAMVNLVADALQQLGGRR